MGPETEQFIIDSLIAELNCKFSLNLAPKLNLARDSPCPLRGHMAMPLRIITVGASLAAGLANAIAVEGVAASRITTPSWRPTPDTMARAATDLVTELNGAGEVTVVFQFLDCAAYYARCEDGGLVPARQGHNEDGPDGTYHLDGELIIAPREMFQHTLKTSLPLFKAAGPHKKIILAPLPRYWISNCCSEADHIPNRLEEDFEDVIFSGIDGLRRQIKDFLFLNKIPNCRVFNTAQLIATEVGGRTSSHEVREALKARWGSDPVHPEANCFTSLAANLLTKLRPSENNSESTDPQPVAKKPCWLDQPGTATVSPSGPYMRGRGFGQTRRGRGGRWWRGHPKRF